MNYTMFNQVRKEETQMFNFTYDAPFAGDDFSSDDLAIILDPDFLG